MARKLTRKQAAARYLGCTAAGAFIGILAALVQNSLSTDGLLLSLIGGALGALCFFAVDRITKARQARPRSHAGEEQDDQEYSRFQNLRNPEDTPDHPQADDQSGKGAEARSADEAIPLKIPEREPSPATPKPTSKLKPLKVPPKARPPTAKGLQGPHSEPHAAAEHKPSDNRSQR